MLNASTRAKSRRTHRDAFVVPFLVAMFLGNLFNGGWQGQSTADGERDSQELQLHRGVKGDVKDRRRVLTFLTIV